MSPGGQSAQLFALAAVGFLAAGVVVAAAVVRFVRAPLARWGPGARHAAIAALALLPIATALGLLFAVSLPSLIALFAPALDHCPAHDDGHAHLCFVHLPHAGLPTGLLAGLAFLGSYAALRAAFAASGIWRAARLVAALARTGERRPDLGFTLLETAQPLCFAAGFSRPRVFVSRGLVETLAPRELAVVLAHEGAHVRRRDALVGCAVRALAALQLPGIGAWLVRELDVAAEQACDEEAARSVADRVAVAEAILAVERAARQGVGGELSPVAVGFGARAVERRVEALLRDPPPPASLRPLTAWIGGSVAIALGFANELHHLTESVLSRVAR